MSGLGTRLQVILGIIAVVVIAAAAGGIVYASRGSDEHRAGGTPTSGQAGSDAHPSVPAPGPGRRGATARPTKPTKPRSTLPPLPPTPTPVLRSYAGTGPMPTGPGVIAAVGSALQDSSLGDRVAAEVVDLSTGKQLYGHRATALATPASVTKIATAAAALMTFGPEHRFTTKVVAGTPPGTVVIVGGGDPTLSAVGIAGTEPSYPGAARVTTLATQAKLAASGPIRRIVVDGTLYSGARSGPGWDSDDISGGDVGRITALTVDGGRQKAGWKPRAANPDLLTGRDVAIALGAPRLPVTRGKAPAGARVLAQVQSPPLGQITETMLAVSDNTLAETLGHNVAAERGRPATFVNAGAAVRDVLAEHGVPTAGIRLTDTSGLSRDDRLSPAALTAILRAAASPSNPHAHLLFSQLPVAGYSGTLAHRYREGAQSAAAGEVRAKTGTLSSVITLAGIVQDADGRYLAFALLADNVSGQNLSGARYALDEVAARLAGCGCR
ncbi:MAG: D-alanyl-D-alanine carboxypeptidase/D-alanyl-D-alanine endopeptidase [Mycobacteriales bacterium]